MPVTPFQLPEALSRQAKLEKILQSYGAVCYEPEPIGQSLYTRRILGEISDTTITTTLECTDAKEIYTLSSWKGPSLTPEQLMPDEVLVKRLCEWQGALLRKQAEAALNKKVPAMLANAQLRWPFPRDN